MAIAIGVDEAENGPYTVSSSLTYLISLLDNVLKSTDLKCYFKGTVQTQACDRIHEVSHANDFISDSRLFRRSAINAHEKRQRRGNPKKPLQHVNNL